MWYKDKQKEREYQRSIPKELKREYEIKYYSTDKGKETRRRKNKKYREKLLKH